MTPTGFDHRTRAWYKDAMTHDGIYWTEPYIAASDNELVLTCARSIIDQTGRRIGVAAADISVDAVTRDFLCTQSERSGSAFLIDDLGRVIAKEGMSNVSIAWDQKYKTENLLESADPGMRQLAVRMTAGETGTCKLNFEGEGSFAGYAPIQSSRWSIAVVMPESKILNPALTTESKLIGEFSKIDQVFAEFIWERFQVFLILSIAIFVAILITATWISRRITEPVLKLKAGAAKIGMGDLDCSLDINTGDELEELAITFNKMSSDLRDYIRDLKETTAIKQRIESDLKIAAEIQMSMLPRIFPPFPERTELDIFASMEPAKEVGGDLYDFDFIDKDRLFVCVGDVSGKGVPAAIFMATAKTMMSGLALQGKSPDEILWETNNYLSKDNDACMFITVFCGILDLTDGTLVCCDGGHNPPLLISGGKIDFLRLPKGLPLGTFPTGRETYRNHTLRLADGDVLFAYTDGVTEAMDKNLALFGDQRLVSVLSEIKGDASCQQFVESVRAAVVAHVGGEEQSDDITMLALKLRG